jgi:hypothetical protein
MRKTDGGSRLVLTTVLIAPPAGDDAWEQRTCGPNKGEWFYDWAWIRDKAAFDAGRHSLLMCRVVGPGDLAFRLRFEDGSAHSRAATARAVIQPHVMCFAGGRASG